MRLRKKTKKIVYGVGKTGRFILNDCIQGFLFLLWLSTPPFQSKLFYSCLGEEFSRSCLYQRLGRLYKKGFIQSIRKGKNFFLRAQKPPEEFVFDEFERLRMQYSQRRWDGLWWLAIYDIPENKKYRRDAFREFIRRLGFGKVQESCWVSPYDLSSQIYEFAKREKSLPYICLYKGKFFAGKSIDDLVEDIWSLRQLDDRYNRWIRLCKENIEKIETEAVDLKESYKIYLETFSLFKNIIKDDPFLPKEFFKNWLRPKVENLFKRFSQVVAKELNLLL